MKYRGLSIVMMLLLISLILAGCGEADEASTTATEHDGTIELTMSWPATDVPLYQESFGKFAEAVYERTDGRVKIIEHFAGQLVPPGENYDATVRGTHDIGTGWIGLHPERFRYLEVVQLTKTDVNFAVINDAVNELYVNVPEVASEFSEVKLLALAASGNAAMGTKKRKVATPEDLAGLKLHAESKIAASLLEKLGAAPMSVMPNEIYTSLQRNIIDGGIFMTEMLYAMNLQEILGYWAMPYPMANGVYAVMNRDKWESLPEDVQRILEDAAKEFVPTGFNDFFLDTKAVDEAAEKHGVEVSQFDADALRRIQQVQDEVRADWVAAMARDGLDGEAVLQEWDALCLKHAK